MITINEKRDRERVTAHLNKKAFQLKANRPLANRCMGYN